MTRSRKQIIDEAVELSRNRQQAALQVYALDNQIDALRKELSALDGLRTPMRLEAFKQEIRK